MTILYTVHSRLRSVSPSSSPPAAHGDSPCPRLACPKIRRKERKKDSRKEERKLRGLYTSLPPLPPRVWWPFSRPHPHHSQEIQDCSSAPLIHEYFLNREPVISSPCLLPYLSRSCLTSPCCSTGNVGCPGGLLPWQYPTSP